MLLAYAAWACLCAAAWCTHPLKFLLNRLRPPDFFGREVPRSGIAYLSNLAVAPCSRREGIGRKLLREASWLTGWLQCS